MRATAAVGLLVVALAAASASTAGASTTTSPSTYASQYMALYDQIAQIVQSDKGNCVKMATDLKAWGVSHKATIAALQAEGPKLSKLALVSVALRIAHQIESDAQTIGTAVATCATNAQVAAALAAQGKLTKP